MRTVFGRITLFVLAWAALSAGMSYGDPLTPEKAREVLAIAGERLLDTVEAVGDSTRFPRSTAPDGSWATTDKYGWTSGFFPGCLWLMYEHTGDKRFLSAARSWTGGLRDVSLYTGSHDVGFMIGSSFGNGWRITGDEEYRSVLVTAAVTLSNRWKRTTEFIRSWDFNADVWRYPVIIDNMMNLELIFSAYRNGGFSELYVIAESHALKSASCHVRPNGGTIHVVDVDPDTGTVIGTYTHQGYSRDSTWARGQAWAIHGFTMAYRETQNQYLLNTAQRVANYFIKRLPGDSVPYWDFDDPAIPDTPRDSSAAAIAASGLIELGTLVENDVDRMRYHSVAAAILGELASDNYLNTGGSGPGILLHGTGNRPADSEVDVSIIYGDYYFIEALLRFTDLDSTGN